MDFWVSFLEFQIQWVWSGARESECLTSSQLLLLLLWESSLRTAVEKAWPEPSGDIRWRHCWDAHAGAHSPKHRTASGRFSSSQVIPMDSPVLNISSQQLLYSIMSKRWGMTCFSQLCVIPRRTGYFLMLHLSHGFKVDQDSQHLPWRYCSSWMSWAT